MTSAPRGETPRGPRGSTAGAGLAARTAIAGRAAYQAGTRLPLHYAGFPESQAPACFVRWLFRIGDVCTAGLSVAAPG